MEKPRPRSSEDDGPVRFCAVTRERRPREELIRFVLSPEGTVVPDLKERLPGRGVWLSASRETVDQAVKKGAFARAFRKQVRCDAALPADLDELLAKQALQAFALAIKAGEVVFGFAKIEEALTRKTVIGLVHAQDGAADGKRKLNSAFARFVGQPLRIVEAFTSAELDLASGRNNVIHAALIEGGASVRFLHLAWRLTRYRGEMTHSAQLSGSNTED